MSNELFQRLSDLILENTGLAQKLQAAETENCSLKSANERLMNGLLTVTEKLENANIEIGRLDLMMKRHHEDLATACNK